MMGLELTDKSPFHTIYMHGKQTNFSPLLSYSRTKSPLRRPRKRNSGIIHYDVDLRFVRKDFKVRLPSIYFIRSCA